MKAKLVIETIKSIKQTAIDKQMYSLAANLRTIERELESKYKSEDQVEVSHFTTLLQTCLIGLPDEQRLLLTPIIRELKLSQLL
jgi:hypothetical protein